MKEFRRGRDWREVESSAVEERLAGASRRPVKELDPLPKSPLLLKPSQGLRLVVRVRFRALLIEGAVLLPDRRLDLVEHARLVLDIFFARSVEEIFRL